MSVKQYKNILIVRTDRIGDVVLTTPVIRALRQQFFDAKISMLVTPATRELIYGHSDLDDVFADDRYGRHQGLIGYYRLIQDIRRRNFDVALILHTKKRTNLACAWAGIPERIGYKNEKYGFLLTTPLKDERHLGEKHEAQYCLDVLQSMGIESHDTTLSLPIQPYARQSLQQWMNKEDVASSKFVVLHPGSSCATKCWPIKSFAMLAKALADEPNTKVVVMGNDDCREAARQIKRFAGGHVIDVTGNLTVGQMVVLLDKANILVSNDSGPVHVAAAVKTPVISLFLRNQPGINPERWKPLGEHAMTLMNKPGEEIILNEKSEVVGGKFDSITVEEVLEQIKMFL